MLFECLYVDSSKARDPKARALHPKRLLGALEYLDAGRPEGADVVFSYHNDETHVRARFVVYVAENADEVGLAFELELPCPTFFVLEALPAALSVAREKGFDMEVLTENGSCAYSSPSFEDLFEAWRRANTKAAEGCGKGYHRGSAPILEAMWEFALVRTDLARRYGRHKLPVPPLYPVVHKRSGKVGRMVDWVGLDRVVLGESDWIRLVEPPKPLVDGAIYSAEELTLACKPLVRTVPQPIFHYLCEKPKQAKELAARVAPLKKLTMRSFEVVEPDRLIDEAGLVEI